MLFVVIGVCKALLLVCVCDRGGGGLFSTVTLIVKMLITSPLLIFDPQCMDIDHYQI